MRYTLLFACTAALGGAITLSGDASAQSFFAHRLRSVATDRCATVAPGELVLINTGCGTSSTFQKYDITTTGHKRTIKNVGLTSALGQAMCVTLGVPEAGAEPTMTTCDGSSSQQWTVFLASPGQHQFCMADVTGAFYCLQAGGAGTNIAVQLKSNNLNQRWRILP